MDTGWIIVGSNADLQIAEVKSESETPLLYDEAKQKALEKLRNHIAPYLEKIEEIESDAFLTSGALPPLRAWQRNCAKGQIVIAKSKKRAIEIVGETRYGFDNDWDECEGVWWYQLAHQESVWMEERNSRGVGNGVFHESLTQEEGETILQTFVAQYLEIDINELIPPTDEVQNRIDTGVSSTGTPYFIKTRIWQSFSDDSKLKIECRIDDGFGLIWRPPAIIERTLPQPEVVAVSGWLTEGF